MGAETKIAWCHHTFNPWEGCEKVSPGCKHCYAEERDGRWHAGENWGPDSKRFLHTDSYWRQPYKWARDAVKTHERRRVFCMSLGDICEDRRDLDEPRARLWEVIRETHRPRELRAARHTPGRGDLTAWVGGSPYGLDWLLLTKRPENLRRLVPEDVLRLCWVGTTAEDQQHADERIPRLLATPGAVRFVSVEPMLGPVVFRDEWIAPSGCMGNSCGLDWVIVGGESGPRARPFDLVWGYTLRDQCKAAAVPFFFKQTGSCPVLGATIRPRRGGERWPKDRAGADPSEWPGGLRIREVPCVYLFVEELE